MHIYICDAGSIQTRIVYECVRVCVCVCVYSKHRCIYVCNTGSIQTDMVYAFACVCVCVCLCVELYIDGWARGPQSSVRGCV